MRPEVQVVYKSIFFITHVDEGGVEAGQQLADFGLVNVAYGVGDIAGLLLQRYQARVFQQCYGHFGGLYIYDGFAFHRVWFMVWCYICRGAQGRCGGRIGYLWLL